MNNVKSCLLLIFIYAMSFGVATADNLDSTNIGAQAKTDERNNKITEKEAKEKEAKEQAITKIENELDKFGFAPALFIVSYNEEILKDSKDVKVRGDGAVSSKGSNYSASMGVELHYDFSFGHKTKCYFKCDDANNWNTTSSHRLSPFLGLFDIENGINGMALGFIYGYTKGDGKGDNKTTLNFGAGWIVHKDRLVLAKGVKEGSLPPTGFNVEDYTERKDVEGITLMVSVNMGF